MCSKCNAVQVAAHGDLCKGCQIAQGRGAELIGVEWKCPQCGRLTELTRDGCVGCEFVRSTWNCITCTFENEMTSNICQGCGKTRQVQAETEEEKEWTCECGATMPKDETDCWKCGKWICEICGAKYNRYEEYCPKCVPKCKVCDHARV